MNKLIKNHKGVVIPMAMIVGAALLLTLLASYQVLKVSTKQNQIIFKKEKAVNVADSGLSLALTRLRLDPDMIPGDEKFHYLNKENGDPMGPGDDGLEIIYGQNGEPIGKFWAMARRLVHGHFSESGVPKEVFHIVTEASLPDGSDKIRIHSFVEISQVNAYFAAIRGQAPIAGGSKLGKGKIYGSEVIFLEPTIPTETGEINYYISGGLSPDTNYLKTFESKVKIYNSLTDTHEKISVSSKPNWPRKLDAPLVFPGMVEERVFYKQYTDNTNPSGDTECDFGPNTSSDPLIPPNQLSGFSREDHYYYCDGDVTITGPLHVAGQVIIIAKGRIKIGGDIKVSDTAVAASKAPPFYFGGLSASDDSTAHQLTLFAEGGIEVKDNWCTRSDIDNNPSKQKTLTLDGVFLVSSLSTVYFPSDRVDCPDNANYKLELHGAMVLSVVPAFSEYFQADRKYTYLETLRSDPPPLRLIYKREYEFETRTDKDKLTVEVP